MSGTGELLLIIGPPAVGKMTVGRAVCERSDFRLFHNHHTIEPLIEVFGFGTPPFEVLNHEFRRRVIEEAARHDVRLVFTFCWDVDSEADTGGFRGLFEPYVAAGRRVSFVELCAALPIRLDRNRGDDRIAHKRSKADPAWSDAHVRELDARHRFSTDPDDPSTPANEVLREFRHLRLDNTHLAAEEVAARVLAWLDARN